VAKKVVGLDSLSIAMVTDPLTDDARSQVLDESQRTEE
jgi:hypothetical protein